VELKAIGAPVAGREYPRWVIPHHAFKSAMFRVFRSVVTAHAHEMRVLCSIYEAFAGLFFRSPRRTKLSAVATMVPWLERGAQPGMR
jgi:hypothetical protein